MIIKDFIRDPILQQFDGVSWIDVETEFEHIVIDIDKI